jgi:Domain of unknown function (DUF6784)
MLFRLSRPEVCGSWPSVSARIISPMLPPNASGNQRPWMANTGFCCAAPFFLGLILGEFVVGSLISLLGVLTGTPTYVLWPY